MLGLSSSSLSFVFTRKGREVIAGVTYVVAVNVRAFRAELWYCSHPCLYFKSLVTSTLQVPRTVAPPAPFPQTANPIDLAPPSDIQRSDFSIFLDAS